MVFEFEIQNSSEISSEFSQVAFPENRKLSFTITTAIVRTNLKIGPR